MNRHITFFAAILVSFLCRGADVAVLQSQTFQTIAGWGHGGGFCQGMTGIAGNTLDPAVNDAINRQYIDYLADDLGLTGSRTWEVGPRVDGAGMDHGDCDVIDWNLFESDTLSATYATNLVYFQGKVLAKGYQPNFYSSPGYPTHASEVKPWVMNHPGERAQQLWASAVYLKNTHGINISYAVMNNEPGGSFTPALLADDIKAVGPRFVAHGLSTLVQYAEAVTPQTDWNYITPVQNDPDMWPFVGRISYHNYGTADPYRSYLLGYAKARGLTTAQTEMGNPTFDDLYSDLTLAGVTYWEVAYSASLTLSNNVGLTAFSPAGTYFRLRQLIHYVRPGAVRIGTTSSTPSVRVLAFTTNGQVTVVIENTSGSAQTVNLSGLPPGTYGVSKAAVGVSSFQELGLQTVGASGTLTLANVAGGSAVTTLYPYAGPNHAPTVEVWGANPGYVVAPANNATLSIIANDAELDALTYHWSVTSQPAGASATLATPNAATTVANNLTVAGTYVFNVDVRDSVNTNSRQVYLVVYDSNPPPVLGQAGFRFAAPYGLFFADPGITTHAIVELPTSSATLQVGISDLANSDFTGRGQWSIVSVPAGATNVTLGATTYIFVSIRANVAGMTVPGDYLFQLVVTNPVPPNLTAQILCTVNPASSAPVINSITASPASLTLPVSSTLLSAAFTGATNTTLRQWWAVKSTPAGAKPVFDHQGATNTTVSNLVLPGNYTFTLRAFDDIHMTTQDKTITVSPAPGAPVITSAAAAAVAAGTPFTYTITASGGPTGFNATNLPSGFTVNPVTGVITGTPTIVGVYNIQLSATNASGAGYGNLALTVGLAPPVIAYAMASPNPVPAQQSTTFSVSAADPNEFLTGQLWNFGDSTTDTNLSPSHVYAQAGNYQATFTITNDLGGVATTSFPVYVTAQQVAGTLQFSATNYFGDKSERFATVSVTRLVGNVGAVQVTCGTSSGTAIAGQDYLSVVTNVAWADGEMGVKSFTIPVIDDDLLSEPDKTVFLSLTNFTGGASCGTASNATLTITANTKANNGLIARWLLDETNGTLAADSSGNGHDGSVANGAWIAGKVSGALHFNGTNSAVTVPTNSSLDMKSGDQFSIAFWVRGLTNNNGGMFLSKRSFGQGGYEVRYTSTFGNFFRANSGAVNLDTKFNTNLLDGQWHHAAAVRTAAGLDTYADGVLQNHTSDSSLAGLSNTNALYFGMQADGNFRFAGDLDDIRIYRRAIPPRLIQALAAGNDDKDADGLPDAWEFLHFGSTTNSNGNGDSDGDGFSDAKELIAGTDPNSAASYFRVDAISNSPPAVMLCVMSATNRVYSLLWQTDLVNGLWNDVPGQTNVSGSGGPLWLSDTNPGALVFHKVGVRTLP